MDDEDPAADANDELDQAPVAPPSQKKKLRIPLKKKPGEKPPASKGLRIQDPTDPPAKRPVVDATHLVVEKPLASKTPRQVVPSDRRTKQRYDPAKQKLAGETVEKAAPKAGAKAVKSSKPKTTVAKPGASISQGSPAH